MTSLRDTPITSGTIIAVAIYSEWLGFYLVNADALIPNQKLATYVSPSSILSLQTWGWAFVASGGFMLARLFLDPKHWQLSVWLHILGMVTSVGWAVSFDLGPVAIAQPAFTMLAVVTFFVPFVAPIIERRYGAKRPPLETRR